LKLRKRKDPITLMCGKTRIAWSETLAKSGVEDGAILVQADNSPTHPDLAFSKTYLTVIFGSDAIVDNLYGVIQASSLSELSGFAGSFVSG
jgi:hypothetical protein